MDEHPSRWYKPRGPIVHVAGREPWTGFSLEVDAAERLEQIRITKRYDTRKTKTHYGKRKKD